MNDEMVRHAAWMARCLGRGELFPFSPAELQELAASIGVQRVEVGGRIFSAGDPLEFMGVIRSGEVELYHRKGMKRVILQIVRDGDLLGDIPFFCQMPAPFSARALSTVTLIRIDSVELSRMLNRYPAMCQRFLYSLASRLERTQRRLLELSMGDLRHQLATLLLEESHHRPDGAINLSQATLADLLGASRPSVNQALKALETKGFVRLGYRQVAVIDVAGLALLSGRPQQR